MQSTEARIGRVTLPGWALGVLGVIGVLVAWEAGSRVGVLDTHSYPPPSRLFETAASITFEGFPRGITIDNHALATASRIVRGYGVAAVAAIPLGLLIGRSPVLDRASAPVVTFARSIATISLLPLAVAWFGVGDLSRILLVAFGAFWIVLTNTVAAVKGVDPVLIHAARTLGCQPSALFRRVILPASLPRIFGGLKVALGMAFLVIVAVEMIGTVEGLGALIMEARTFYRTDVAIVGMALLGLFGFLLAKALDRLEAMLLPWSTPDEAAP